MDVDEQSQVVNIEDEEEAAVSSFCTLWSIIHKHLYLNPQGEYCHPLEPSSHGEIALPIFHESEALEPLAWLCLCQEYTFTHSRFPSFLTGSHSPGWL